MSAVQKIVKPNGKTFVSPLSGCFQDSCYLTTIDNALYSAALASWTTSLSGLTALEAAYLANDSTAGTVALDALKAALTLLPPAVEGAIALNIRSRPIFASTDVALSYYSTAYDPDLVAADPGSGGVFGERAFGVGLKSFIGRVHTSDKILLDIFVQLAPNTGVTCITTCPSGPGPTPTPSTDCLPDESSSEECGNRYGYNFPFFPAICDTTKWAPLK